MFIRNLFLVYYIVSNAVKMFKKMSISLIKNLISIKAYFLFKKCYYNLKKLWPGL